MHYWSGLTNYAENTHKKYWRAFTRIKDTIKINTELGNHIPDKSWMLYLLEVFNAQQIPAELNLISQFDGQNYFEAIFNGFNKYRFKEILPKVGHIYHREILFERDKNVITYLLYDNITGKQEDFSLKVNGSFKFLLFQSFTGIEWWNKVGHYPYPIPFEVEIYDLMYGLNDDQRDLESVLYFPIDHMNSNTDGQRKEYPIKFHKMELINQSIHYKVL